MLFNKKEAFFLKKLLSILGISILSFSLFVGCGVDTKANEAAGEKLTNTLTSINQNTDSLDDESKEEVGAIAKEIQELAASKPDTSSQEGVDALTKKYEEYTAKLKAIADENEIEISESATTAK